ncbi:type II toxin-antitoxin system Phd/YefM family antitoxin [Terrihalobacillus insolitus]|uniref:type II toxin-antitoxin system Phd/YefM family antitoxin n=1 Tax=Terrihalobacillus insolitus TaxID=2950438 RepID=UPI0023409930|nr:type II toxin-antitoxin system Phd/YefM family antitoxin [Terrihalobacillus insolitus]MDC3412625.1 type II toxin-antitoxin system Phd/YefM family antitoxin [Terrihalobacillus insolitus]
MIVSSTEVQNNFGKYLMLAAKEEIIITRNGIEFARLQSMEGKLEPILQESIVKETAEPYHFKGRKASYEEFLELTCDDEVNRYEYIDGKIYLLASPTTRHQYAVTEMLVSFHQWFRGEKCTPFVAPFDIHLKRPNFDDPSVVQPDLMVICNLDNHLDERDYYTGVPSLVAEVLSRSTQSNDLVKKLDLYMTTGVNEYWIVNPFNKAITIYGFKNNEVNNIKTYKHSETAQSFLFEGLSVELERIFKP